MITFDLVNSYFSLGFFNILFAWLGMIDFSYPLLLQYLPETSGFA